MQKREGRTFFPKNRRGSHVGMVISFVIFITFLTFLYSVLRPALKISGGEPNTLNSIEEKLIENISRDLTVITIKINNSVAGGCVKFENLTNETGLVDYKVVLKDDAGNLLTSHRNSSSLYVNRNNNENLIKVYYSEEFNETNVGPDICTPLVINQNYSFGLIRTKKYAFENSIIKLLDYYTINYPEFKEELEVPERNEFGFSFRFENKTLVETNDSIRSTEVYVSETSIPYFNSDAVIYEGRLNAKLW